MTVTLRVALAAPALAALSCFFAIGCRRKDSTEGADGSARADFADARASASVDERTGASVGERTGASVGERKQVTVEGNAMGTRLRFVALTSERVGEEQTRAAIDNAIGEVKRLEALMTTWRDDSEVSRVNAGAGRVKVKVSPETLRVVEESLSIGRRSEGVFDITFEAMHGLWKFDEDADPHPPPAAAIAERRKLIDYRRVIIDKAESSIFIDKPGMKISLGGIAKGYAIDKAAEALLAAGVTDFLAQAGGDLYVRGKKADGSSWVAGVRDPRGPEGSFFALMPVTDHAFSTAGDYERSYVVGGRRYHHIIDPRTGSPAEASRSVTIWAKDALTADALDDAVFILGPKKGLELVEATEDAGAVIVDRENRVWISRRLEGKIRIERQPSGGI